jgi:hypothetical protein
MENWKDIKNEKGYQVSDLGRIRSLLRKTPKILKVSTSKDGYEILGLTNKKTVYVHQITANAFLDNPNNYPTVDHIDRNRKNNAITNLRFANYQMQKDNSEGVKGITHGRSKLKNEDIIRIKELKQSGMRVTKIAKIFNIGHGTVSKIINGKNWSHIK